MLSPTSEIGPHRLLIVKKYTAGEIIKYEGHILSSKVRNSNKYTLRYPNNIYVNVYDHILVGKYRGVTRKPCYINVREYFEFDSDDVQGSGTFKGKVTKEFLQFVQECERRVSTNDNQYWRWINGEAVNEEPSGDMTDEEFYEAMQYLPSSDNPFHVDDSYYARKEQRMKNHEWVGRTTFIEGKLWKCIAAETSEDDIVKLVPVGSNTSTEMTISGDKIWDIRWNKQK